MGHHSTDTAPFGLEPPALGLELCGGGGGVAEVFTDGRAVCDGMH